MSSCSCGNSNIKLKLIKFIKENPNKFNKRLLFPSMPTFDSFKKNDNYDELIKLNKHYERIKKMKQDDFIKELKKMSSDKCIHWYLSTIEHYAAMVIYLFLNIETTDK